MYLVHLASKFSSFSSKEVSLLGFTLQQASKLSVLRNRFSSFTLFGLFVFSLSHKVHCGSESLSAFSAAVQSFWLFSSYGLINWPQDLHVYMENHKRVFFFSAWNDTCHTFSYSLPRISDMAPVSYLGARKYFSLLQGGRTWEGFGWTHSVITFIAGLPPSFTF